MRVLIVEDEPRIRHLMSRQLEDHGLAVTGAVSVEAARGMLKEYDFAFVILDISLPDGSGLQVLDALRDSGSRSHVIVVSESVTESDRVQAFESGADDYVVKPFSVRELAARILAVRRRSAPDGALVHIGPLTIDLPGRQVTLDDRPVELTAKEFDLLAFLASRPGHVFNRDQLLHAVWQSAAEWQGSATVTEHVRRLRAKIELDPHQPRLVHTVRGAGYRLDLPPASSDDQLRDEYGGSGRTAASGTIIHLDGDIVSADIAAVSLLGYTDSSDLVGHPVVDLLAPTAADTARVPADGTTAGETLRSKLIDLRRADGTEESFEVTSRPVDWHAQPAMRAEITTTADLSSRLRSLATGVLTELTDAVIITDLRHHVRSWNQAAEALYGWRSEEALGRHMLDVIQFGGRHDELIDAWETFEETGRWIGEDTHIARDGSPVDVLASASLVRDEKGRPVGVVYVNRPAPKDAPMVGLGANVHDEAELRLGLARDELEVYYQPLVTLHDGRVVGVEALVRWHHPTRGLLAAEAFLGAAEHTDLIIGLGTMVLDEACHQVSTWRRAGVAIEVAVNISARQLADPGLVDRVAALLASSGLEPGVLWLEVTETALVEKINTASHVLGRLVDLGVRISIDDFGTGWASLAYLRSFPVHALKIDRSFVSGPGHSATDTAIARSILSLGAELGLQVVAEGIETVAQQEALQQLGCSLGQGFLYGQASVAADVPLHRARRIDEVTATPGLRPPGRVGPPVAVPLAPQRSDRAPDAPDQAVIMTPDLSPAASRFLALATTGHPRPAIDLAIELLATSLTVDRLILDVLCPVQREVGRRWEVNEWSAAQEHAVTAVVDAALGAVGLQIPVPAVARGTVLVACAHEEQHTLPARMGAERLRADGWDVSFLGAGLPARDLRAFAASVPIDAVVLSCTMPLSLPGAARGIAALADLGLPVVAAGPAFGESRGRAARLGASGWIGPHTNATALLSGALAPATAPRWADGEAESLERQAPAVVAATLDELLLDVPEVSGYSDEKLAHTRADLGSIVACTGLALRLAEPELLDRFLDWLATVLVSRGVTREVLDRSLHVLADVLARADLGRAAAICAPATARVGPGTR